MDPLYFLRIWAGERKIRWPVRDEAWEAEQEEARRERMSQRKKSDVVSDSTVAHNRQQGE